MLNSTVVQHYNHRGNGGLLTDHVCLSKNHSVCWLTVDKSIQKFSGRGGGMPQDPWGWVCLRTSCILRACWPDHYLCSSDATVLISAIQWFLAGLWYYVLIICSITVLVSLHAYYLLSLHYYVHVLHCFYSLVTEVNKPQTYNIINHFQHPMYWGSLRVAPNKTKKEGESLIVNDYVCALPCMVTNY